MLFQSLFIFSQNMQNMRVCERKREMKRVRVRSKLFDFDWSVSLHGASQVAATVATIMTAIRLLAGYHIVHAAAATETPVCVWGKRRGEK